jgi:tetratricopeptide (TPR) repeat protein
MTGNTDQIIMTLFGTGKLEEVPIEELKDLVKNYPSFNIGHYLLSKRLVQEKNDDSTAANLITALYFNNPFWLQWLLQNSDNESSVVKESDAIFSFESRISYPSSYSETYLAKEKELFSFPLAKDRDTIAHNEETLIPRPPEKSFQDPLVSDPIFHEDESADIENVEETDQTDISQDFQTVDQIDDLDQESSPVLIQPTDTQFMENEHSPIAQSDPTLSETTAWIESPDPGIDLTFHENEELARIAQENERLEKEWQEALFQLRMLEERAAALRQFDPSPASERPAEMWTDETMGTEVKSAETSNESPTLATTALTDPAIPAVGEDSATPRQEMDTLASTAQKDSNNSIESFWLEKKEDEDPDSDSSQAVPIEPKEVLMQDTAEKPDSTFWINSAAERPEEVLEEEVQNPISILYEESAKLTPNPVSEMEAPMEAVSLPLDSSHLSEEITDIPTNPDVPEPEQAIASINIAAIEENTAVEPAGEIGDKTDLEEPELADFIDTSPLIHQVDSSVQENPAYEAPDTPIPIDNNFQDQLAQVSSLQIDPNTVPPVPLVDEPIVKTDQPKVAAIAPTEEVPLFDPYHTIDYFASQGIKFIYQENPNDKFGKQLKSFTDWLKIMKRLPQKQVQATIEQAMDSSSIESFAAHSLDENDTLTETMAMVLIKQGKYEKAIEIYQKLSLLNPTKNAYFAAKIEELKTY